MKKQIESKKCKAVLKISNLMMLPKTQMFTTGLQEIIIQKLQYTRQRSVDNIIRNLVMICNFNSDVDNKTDSRSEIYQCWCILSEVKYDSD